MNTITSVIDSLYTIYLFTKSDIKTTVVPITVLATAAALRDLSRIPHVVLWVWMHTLQINLANQILDPEEDKLNKKDRPLASGRITLRNATLLRWASVPACLALSACYSMETVYASIAISILTILYDELGGHLSWMTRSTLLPAGYSGFEIGACLIAGANPHKLSNIALMSVIVSAGAYATTHQATDFKDIEGDRLIGRNTIPIAAPILARPILAVLMCLWSFTLASLWELDAIASTAFVALGVSIGVRFMTLRTVKDDRGSCLYYNIWLSMIHILPAYWRFRTAAFV